MRLPNLALNNRVVVCVAVVMLCIWGYLSFQSAPRRETPEFTVRVCVVSTLWPGATVKSLEQLVAEPLEQAVSSIDEVERIDTTVTPGQSIIQVTLDDFVAPSDIANVWDEVRAEVAKVALPTDEGCQPAVVNSNFGDTAVWLLAVYQDPAKAAERRYGARQLEVFADQLRDQIKLLPEVADAELHGVQQEVIYLESDARTWGRLALTTDQLAARIAQRNIVAGGGSLELPEGRVLLKPSGNYDTVAQINRLVVARDADSGNPVYLEDLGIDVRRGYVDPPRDIYRYTNTDPAIGVEGAEVVLIAITMKDGRNVVQLGDELRSLVARAETSLLPEDVDTALIIDTPTKVATTISDFVVNLAESVALVLLVAILLIGVRIAIIMAAAIPVVMLGVFALMRLVDVELEQMSIAALVIALGMLVDNVIEVCDNIDRLLHEGVPRRKAALEGAAQIGFPVLIATLTTIASFVPMVIALEGAGSEYVFSIPAVVTIALSLSWVLAMTFTTVLAYWFLRRSESLAPLAWLADRLGRVWRTVRRKNGVGQPATGGAGLYQRLARRAVDFKFVTIGLGVGGFAFAVFLLATGQIGSQFFPSAVQSKFLVEVYLPDGSPIHQTAAKCGEVEAMVLAAGRAEPAADGGTDPSATGQRVRDILTMVGNGGPRFELGFDPADPASNYGVLVVKTKTPGDVDPLIERIQERARSTIAGARVRAIRFGMGPPVANPIGVRILGPGFADIGRMRAIADDVVGVFRGSSRTWDITQNWGNLGLQLDIDIDESKATTVGVSSADVSRSLATYYSGRFLTTFREGDHQVPCYFRWRPDERDNLDLVAVAPIEGSNSKVPLATFASTAMTFAPQKIVRRNINRAITVSARPVEGVLANTVLLEDLWPQLLEYEETLPEGYDIQIAGELEESADAQAQMGLSFQITLALLILLLIVQYNSLSKALLILVTIPLATTGAFVGMWVFGFPMGFMEMLGLLALVGIVLNAAIVYLEFAEMLIEQKRDEGGHGPVAGERDYVGLSRAVFRDCLARAGQLRLLPIALTTLTTAGGLLPLAMDGGPLFEGMATAIICGLLVGSVLTLFVLPALVGLFVEWFRIRLIHDAVAEE